MMPCALQLRVSVVAIVQELKLDDQTFHDEPWRSSRHKAARYDSKDYNTDA
jgi:hypothetical protein